MSSRRPITPRGCLFHDRGALLDHVLLEQVHQEVELPAAAASSFRSTGNRASAARCSSRAHSSVVRRTLATPRRCPSMRGRPCRCAQRPLPSMMMAMCRGICAAARAALRQERGATCDTGSIRRRNSEGGVRWPIDRSTGTLPTTARHDSVYFTMDRRG